MKTKTSTLLDNWLRHPGKFIKFQGLANKVNVTYYIDNKPVQMQLSNADLLYLLQSSYARIEISPAQVQTDPHDYVILNGIDLEGHVYKDIALSAASAATLVKANIFEHVELRNPEAISSFDRIRRTMIIAALKQHKTRTDAAKSLNITPAGLHYICSKYNISFDRIRQGEI